MRRRIKILFGSRCGFFVLISCDVQAVFPQTAPSNLIKETELNQMLQLKSHLSRVMLLAKRILFVSLFLSFSTSYRRQFYFVTCKSPIHGIDHLF